jgi:hypothetical protein
MALTQVESERACLTSRGSNKATKSVLVKEERCADLKDCVTLSFKLPMSTNKVTLKLEQGQSSE